MKGSNFQSRPGYTEVMPLFSLSFALPACFFRPCISPFLSLSLVLSSSLHDARSMNSGKRVPDRARIDRLISDNETRYDDLYKQFFDSPPPRCKPRFSQRWGSDGNSGRFDWCARCESQTRLHWFEAIESLNVGRSWTMLLKISLLDGVFVVTLIFILSVNSPTLLEMLQRQNKMNFLRRKKKRSKIRKNQECNIDFESYQLQGTTI